MHIKEEKNGLRSSVSYAELIKFLTATNNVIAMSISFLVIHRQEQVGLYLPLTLLSRIQPTFFFGAC
jgi:hypothetical protein